HTAGSNSGASADDITLANGDVMSADAPPSVDMAFSRFSMMLNDLSGRYVPYDKLRANVAGTGLINGKQPTGLVDLNRNGIPDFAYVTGTGAHDRITLYDGGLDAQGRRKILVTVEAYSDAAHTLRIGQALPYTIVVGVDTEGPIRIDGQAGDDVITVAATLKNKMTIYGGQGNDTITSGAGDDNIYGEQG